MDREMMRALQADAEMLEAMGAGEQPLAFFSDHGKLCDDCLDNYADFDSHLCVGCEAYRDHQQ